MRGHEVALVLTQPDRPAGRSWRCRPPPVKRFAVERGLRSCSRRRSRRTPNCARSLSRLRRTRFWSSRMAGSFRSGCSICRGLGNINLHGSLLPKYRGAAPIQWAIANGERETGVTTMRLDAGLDTGDILLERAVPVPEDATCCRYVSGARGNWRGADVGDAARTRSGHVAAACAGP